MPLEMDYEFGKRAVSAGHLKQDQLEECVEILVALERVGSKQRLWQIVQRKAYMTEAAIAEIRASLESAARPARRSRPLRSRCPEAAPPRRKRRKTFTCRRAMRAALCWRTSTRAGRRSSTRCRRAW